MGVYLQMILMGIVSAIRFSVDLLKQIAQFCLLANMAASTSIPPQVITFTLQTKKPWSHLIQALLIMMSSQYQSLMVLLPIVES